MIEVVMALSWPEYLEELSQYLERLRHTLEVGFSAATRIPERPEGPPPEQCVVRVVQLHFECEALKSTLREHLEDLEKRSTFAPAGPHAVRAANYVATDL